jgi:hypothetical protein
MKHLVRGVLIAAAVAVVPASLAFAGKNDISVKPSAFSCNGTGVGNGQNAQAQWTNKESETGKFSVLLEKSAATPNCSGAAALVKGVEGLTVAALGDIGFSVKGQCTGGSPRYNLLYDTNNDGQFDGVAFYGCANHPAGPGAKPGWSKMLVDAETSDSGPVPPTATVFQLYVLADEQGTSYVDNLVAAGQTSGEPNGS